MDFAKEILFNKIDSQFPKFGEPKLRKDLGLPEMGMELTENDITEKAFSELKRENAWIEANAFTLKNRSDSRFSHHGKENRKKKNKKLAKAKGYNLDACARPDKSGSRNVLSNRFCKGYKKWFPDPVKMEQNKISARELKKYFDSPVEKQTEEEYFKDFLEETYDKSLKELVDEYLKLRYEVMIKNDPYRHFKRNDFLNIMSVDTEHDAMERFYRYGEWLDYNTLYVTLFNLIHKMKQRKRTFAPVFEIAESVSDNFYIHVRVTTEMFPDNFDISDLAHCSGLFIEREAIQARHVVAYRFHVLTEAKEQFPLFTVDRSTYTARELDYISKELNDRFETLSHNLWWEENWWEENWK